jgi:hypothetical protein
MLTGQCLCGTVAFTLSAQPLYFYRCHCSLCRRQTGTGYNCATIVTESSFEWQAGQAEINTWRKPTGYRNDFCKQCGSTVPNALRGSRYVWVPLGLLAAQGSAMTCVGDYCVGEAMGWDTLRSEHVVDACVESLDSLLGALRVAV